MSTLSLNQVSKVYHKDQVIHDINLTINDGEFIAIVGESGCGKSTLLRMIAGLEHTTSGIISIDGQDITNKEPKDRDIAMVFQNYALYPHMSVYDNIAYSLKVRGVSKQQIQTRVADISKLLRLNHLLERKPNQLSGGQRQRVAMGRAIIRDPKLFLFDEPLSNLDAKLRVDMRLEIRKLQQKLKITSLYVTHDQVEAMTMADKIAILNKGHIEQFATPEMIYKKPASMFVAGFIGAPTMNFLPATTTEHAIALENGIIIPVKLGQHHHVGKKVIIGIRPEHISLSEENDEVDIVITVDTIEYLGGETLVYGAISNGSTRLTVKIEDHWPGKSGDTLHVHTQKQHIHAFDPESQLRLDLHRNVDSLLL